MNLFFINVKVNRTFQLYLVYIEKKRVSCVQMLNMLEGIKSKGKDWTLTWRRNISSKKFTPLSTFPLFEEPSAVGDSSTLTPLVESSAFGSPTVFHKQSHPPAEIRSEFRLWKSSSFGAPTEFCLWSPPQLVNETALRKRIVTFFVLRRSSA